MKKIIDWIKKFLCRPKEEYNNLSEERQDEYTNLPEERQDELWEMFQKSPERFDFYYHDGYRFVEYKETGEYFWF